MAIVVSEFMTKDTIQYGLIAAAGMLALIPPALTALIFRKYLISGMTKGSVKDNCISKTAQPRCLLIFA